LEGNRSRRPRRLAGGLVELVRLGPGVAHALADGRPAQVDTALLDAAVGRAGSAGRGTAQSLTRAARVRFGFGFPIVSSRALNSATAADGSCVMLRRYSRVRSEPRVTISPESPVSSSRASSSSSARV